MGRDMREFFSKQSDYLKAADLKGREVTVVIDGVGVKKFNDGEKPFISFRGKEKGVILNKTNGGRIMDAFGSDSEDWIEKEVILYPEKVPYEGSMVDAIRVRIPVDAASDDEDIPF